MKRVTQFELREMHARYAVKGACDHIDHCLNGGLFGDLYEVDTQGAGCDSLVASTTEEMALAVVAEHYLNGQLPDGTAIDDDFDHAAWALSVRWTAERVVLR